MLFTTPFNLQILVAFLGSFGVALFVRKNAKTLRVIDLPNERSLHSHPKPRGGGLGIVLFGLIQLFPIFGQSWTNGLMLSAGLVALIGWLDDIGGVSARNRLLVHFIAAIIFIAGLDAAFTLNIVSADFSTYWLWPFAAIFLVWMLNLYNFMDGVDGLGGTQAFTSAIVLGAMAIFAQAPELTRIFIGLAAATLGFLVLNWPPAKIFMGDVCSGFLGFVFGALAIYAAVKQQIPLVCFLIVFGYFIVDSGVTLLNRAIRRIPIYLAHREHAYQQLVQRGVTHKQISLGVGCLNIFWLGPLAVYCQFNKNLDLALLLIAYGPIILFCGFCGAGRPFISRRN